MFDDLFNFAKKRTLKESVGFYIFYVCLFYGAVGVLEVFGLV